MKTRAGYGVFFNKSKNLFSFAIFWYSLKGVLNFFFTQLKGVPEKHKCIRLGSGNCFIADN